MTSAFERRLAAAEAKLPRPRDEVLAQLEQWLATLSNDALEWVEQEYRAREERGAAPMTDAEAEQITEIAAAITEERFCPIGSDPVSRWNWRWRYWKPGDPSPG